ncbi:hypothetical protein MUP00_11880 [Candidatus Bathyarchaeota archaeon]|nr:hypothetical protein [Candidatus Bathyarchaeota archaeon]
MSSTGDKESIRHMSELLRSGATMTADHCPVCNTPLFRFKGQLFCPKCDKPVVIVKEGEEESTAKTFSVLGDLEKTLIQKIQESNQRIIDARGLDEAKESGNLLNIWLQAMERLKRVQQQQRE